MPGKTRIENSSMRPALRKLPLMRPPPSSRMSFAPKVFSIASSAPESASSPCPRRHRKRRRGEVPPNSFQRYRARERQRGVRRLRASDFYSEASPSDPRQSQACGLRERRRRAEGGARPQRASARGRPPKWNRHTAPSRCGRSASRPPESSRRQFRRPRSHRWAERARSSGQEAAGRRPTRSCGK